MLGVVIGDADTILPERVILPLLFNLLEDGDGFSVTLQIVHSSSQMAVQRIVSVLFGNFHNRLDDLVEFVFLMPGFQLIQQIILHSSCLLL
ncbi:hypothetical protein D3C72_2356270 [compost metagenome]